MKKRKRSARQAPIFDSDAIALAKNRIDNALFEFTFHFHIVNAIKERRLTAQDFARPFTFDEGSHFITVPGVDLPPEKFANAAVVHLRAGAKLAAVAAHSAWKIAQDNGLPTTANDAGALDILTEIRKAVAHDPITPIGIIDRERKRKLSFVDHLGNTVEMDARHLTGQVVAPQHFGGWAGFIQLLHFAQFRVGQTSTGGPFQAPQALATPPESPPEA